MTITQYIACIHATTMRPTIAGSVIDYHIKYILALVMAQNGKYDRIGLECVKSLL